MKQRNLHRVLFAFFSFLLLLEVLLFWRAKDDALIGVADFSTFYSAGWMVRHGLGPQLYNSDMQRRVRSEVFPNLKSWTGALIYDHPPFEALLYVPLAYVPYRAAYLIWLTTNVLILLLVVVLLSPYMRELKAIWNPLPVLLFIGFFPAFISLLQGQDSILLLLIFTLVFVSLKRGRDFHGGFIQALGLFKLQYVLPFMLLFLVWRRWKMAAGFAASSAVLFLLSLAVAGFQGTLSYATLLMNLIRGLPAHHVQNLLGFLSNMMPNIRGAVEMMSPVLLNQRYQKPIVVLLSGIAMAWVIRKRPLRPELSGKAFDHRFSLALVVSILVSYYVLLHDLTLLLIPFALSLGHAVKARVGAAQPQLLLYSTIAIFFLSPLYLWFLQHGILYLLFWPILLFAMLLSREIGPHASAAKEHAGENPQDQVPDLT